MTADLIEKMTMGYGHTHTHTHDDAKTHKEDGFLEAEDGIP